MRNRCKLQSTTVKGDVSVCTVPANVVYLFIYILVYVPREKEMANSLACLFGEQCQALNRQYMPAWDSQPAIWDIKCAAEGIIHLFCVSDT